MRHEALNPALYDYCGACQERCCEAELKILNCFIATADRLSSPSRQTKHL